MDPSSSPYVIHSSSFHFLLHVLILSKLKVSPMPRAAAQDRGDRGSDRGDRGRRDFDRPGGKETSRVLRGPTADTKRILHDPKHLIRE